MIRTKIQGEFLNGPRCGQRFEVYRFVGTILDGGGKYIRDEKKTKEGRILFRWVSNQKGGSK